MGWLDEDGYLYLADRRTDLVLRGGAIVQLKPGSSGATDDEALKACLKERIASYKIPTSFEFVADFLRDEAGKVRRAALRAERLKAR